MTVQTDTESPILPNYISPRNQVASPNGSIPGSIDNFSSVVSSSLRVQKTPSQMSSDDPMSPTRKKKVIITGDDILIEYVRRIKHELRKIREPLPSNLEFQILKFVNHKVWQLKGQSVPKEGTKLVDLMKARFKEMKRRKKAVQE